MSDKPEALRLADAIWPWHKGITCNLSLAAAELRRLHAEVERLRAEQSEPVDLIPQDALFVCGQMGANVTRVTVEQQAEPVREWVPLTDEDWQRVADKTDCVITGKLKDAIDTALKEKNHG